MRVSESGSNRGPKHPICARDKQADRAPATRLRGDPTMKGRNDVGFHPARDATTRDLTATLVGKGVGTVGRGPVWVLVRRVSFLPLSANRLCVCVPHAHTQTTSTTTTTTTTIAENPGVVVPKKPVRVVFGAAARATSGMVRKSGHLTTASIVVTSSVA